MPLRAGCVQAWRVVSRKRSRVIQGLNHITLAVSDVRRSTHFYRDLLGLRARACWPKGAYFSAGTLWFCIVQDDQTRSEALPEYTHLAFHVPPDAFSEFAAKLRTFGCTIWKVNESEGDSLYFLDPDGHKLEIHATDLETRLAAARLDPWDGLKILD